MFSFQQLERIFFNSILKEFCHLERVIYTANSNSITSMIQALGDRVVSQLYSADYIMLYANDTTQTKAVKKLLQSYNPECSILVNPTTKDIHNKLTKPIWPWSLYGITGHCIPS